MSYEIPCRQGLGATATAATVNTTLAAPPFQTGQQASRAATTIKGPSPRGLSFPGFEPGSRRY
jgi:hypothetical protein